MKLPQWLIKKRHDTCQQCIKLMACPDAINMFDINPRCMLGALHSLEDELRWERAWPSQAPKVSGCCDSALHPAS